jgi:hypothetical protein
MVHGSSGRERAYLVSPAGRVNTVKTVPGASLVNMSAFNREPTVRLSNFLPYWFAMINSALS